MRKRNPSRDEALEEYLIYRKRVRELLDIGKIAADIMGANYNLRDSLGREPERFSETVGDVLIGWFASLMDPHGSALNAFDVWRALFPAKKGRIDQTWEKVKPHIPLIRDYRSDVVCHANKNVRRYIQTRRRFNEKLGEILRAMQAVMSLAAELMRDEPTALPNIRADVDPILKRLWQGLSDEQIEGLKDYFLRKERVAD